MYMKKLFLILTLSVLAITSQAQNDYGYTYIAQRYKWLAGLFQALGLPVGDSARFQTGQHQRQGAVYMDTVNTNNSPNGYYIYEDPSGGNSPFWNLQRTSAQICQNRLLTPWNVSWQGTGFSFTVHGGQPNGQGSYQIGCNFYTEDSATVTLPAADPTLERIDVIYLDATGIHVRAGDLATVGAAQKPTITLDEIELTFITVGPGATEPALTTLIVYDENTESNVTNIGTTTNADNLTHVYHGVKSINVTNVNHNDMVNMTKVLGGSWNVLGLNGLTIGIELKPTFPNNSASNIAVSLLIGTVTVGTEVLVPIVKTNNSTYQQITIPLSSFGTLNNTNITTVRVRVSFPTSPSFVYPGFYLDYIYFVGGINQPGGGNQAAQFTLNMPTGFTVNPTNTQQSGGGWTVTTQTALAGQYYTKEGWVTLPDLVKYIGTLDGQTKSVNGAVMFNDSLFMQLADTTYPGLLSPELYRKISRNDSVTNGNPGDTLLVKLNDTTLLVKALVAGTNMDFDITDQNITLNATGGAGNPGEGIAVTGDSIHLGGTIAAPATNFSQSRVVNTAGKSMYWTDGAAVTDGGEEWIVGNRSYSPYNMSSTDTISVNGSPTSPTQAVPLSGIFANRNVYFNSGIYRLQKLRGHDFRQTWNYADSLSFDTQGGDYDEGVHLEQRYLPRGAGRQVQRASHGTANDTRISWGVPTVLGNTVFENNVGNYIYARGHYIGFQSYVTFGYNNADTIQNMVYYSTGGFRNIAGSKILKSYDFAPAGYSAASVVDSAYGWFDTARVKRWYQANKTVIGPSVGTTYTWSSSDQLKVLGNFNLTDSMHLGKASLIGDSTGMDFVLRRRTDGALFRIRADLMTFLGGGGIGGIDDVLAFEQLLTVDREINTDDNRLFIYGTNGQGTLSVQNLGAGAAIHGTVTGGGVAGEFRAFSNYGTLSWNTSLINASGAFEKENGRQDIVKPLIELSSHTLGDPDSVAANGFGASIDTYLENSNEDKTFAGSIKVIWDDVTDGSEDSRMEFWGMVGGVPTLLHTIDAGGGGGEATTIGAFQTTGNAAGLSLSGTDIRLHAATTTQPGGVIVGSGLAVTSGGVLSNIVGGRLNTGGTTFNSNNYVINFIEGSGVDITLGNSSGNLDVTINATGDGTGLTQEQVEDIVGDLFGTDNGDIDFTYNDGTPDVAAQIKAGAIVNADINASAAIDGSKIDGSSISKGFMYDVLTLGGVSTRIPRMNWWENFMGGVGSAAGNVFLGELITGSGANASVSPASSGITGASGFGYGVVETGTTTTGRGAFSGINLVNANTIGKVDNDVYYRIEFENVIVNDLSDGTDTYTLTLGFKVDNAVTNGLYFTYTNGTNSGKWVTNSYNNATPETQNYSGTAVAADTEYDLAIEYYNQTAKFYLDGTLIATHTTQVPAAAAAMQGVYMSVLKSAGTNNRQVFVDNIRMRVTHENDL